MAERTYRVEPSEAAYGHYVRRPGYGPQIARNGWTCHVDGCDRKPTDEVGWVEPCRGSPGWRTVKQGACPEHVDEFERLYADDSEPAEPAP